MNGEVNGGNKLFDSEEVDNFEKLHNIAKEYKDLFDEFEKMTISLHYHHMNGQLTANYLKLVTLFSDDNSLFHNF